MAEASIEQQDDYIDNLHIDTFDQSSINKFEIRVTPIKASAFITQLEMIIQSRKNQKKYSLLNIWTF